MPLLGRLLLHDEIHDKADHDFFFCRPGFCQHYSERHKHLVLKALVTFVIE